MDGHNYTAAMYDPWTDRNQLMNDMFDPLEFKKRVDILYFDLPGLLEKNEIGYRFWNALAESDNLNFYSKRITQVMISLKWTYIYKRMKRYTQWPLILFMAL